MPLPSSHSVAGRRADADHDQVGVSSVPSVSITFSTCSSPRTSATPTPLRTSTPSARCSRATNAPICSPSTDGQRRRLRLDQHHVDAEPAQAGRHLAADEPGADHHRVLRGGPACSRSARLSSNVRSTRMPSRSGNDGIRRGTRPVAMTSSS